MGKTTLVLIGAYPTYQNTLLYQKFHSFSVYDMDMNMLELSNS